MNVINDTSATQIILHQPPTIAQFHHISTLVAIESSTKALNIRATLFLMRSFKNPLMTRTISLI